MSKKYTIRKIEDKKEYTPFIIRDLVPLTEEWWYGDLQIKMGKKVLRVSISFGGEIVGFAQVILYPFFGKKTYAYIPYGPIINKIDFNLHKELEEYVNVFFKEENIVCVRQEIAESISNHFKKTPKVFVRGGYVQPRFEWEIALLDLDSTLFASYRKQTRKNIRRAESLGVYVKIFDSNLVENFHILISLLKQTAGRKSFLLYEEEYYKEMVKILDREKNGFLAIAYGQDNVPLSGSLHVIVGKMAYGIFGGSSNERRDEFGPFILKYHAMKYARKCHCTSFSIGGIIPPGEDKQYKSWQGFSHFKQSFGGFYLSHGLLVDHVFRKKIYFSFLILKFLKYYVRIKRK